MKTKIDKAFDTFFSEGYTDAMIRDYCAKHGLDYASTVERYGWHKEVMEAVKNGGFLKFEVM